MRMTEPGTASSISDALSSWGALAQYLLASEKSMGWGQTHSSFSSWLSDCAKELKRSEATLWRALAAGRYYNELRAEFIARGVTLPELGSPQLAASPEGLELADKIARVAPAEVVQQITQKVVEGKISRRELRTYWETYRPILNGMTARGRNVQAPRFNPRSIDMLSNRLEADCIAGLIAQGPSWLGDAKAHLYKVIPITESIVSRLRLRFVPDVIVLYQPSQRDALEIHGVETTARPDDSPAIRHYLARGSGADHFWIATPTETESRTAGRHQEIGLLEADPNGVKVLRRAGPAKQDQGDALTLLRALLSREVVA
jgi:hypothetical protein